MSRRGFVSHPARILSTGCLAMAAIAALTFAALVPGVPAPWRSFLSSNDFLTGGSALNGAVLVTCPADPNGPRSGLDPAGYVARAFRTNPQWGLGDFAPIFPMSEYRHGAGTVIARGPLPMEAELALSPPRDSVSYLYVAGGMSQGVVSGTIERAEIDAEGNVFPGLVSQAGLLLTPRYGAAVVARGDYLYVIGGYDGNDLPVTTIERLRIDEAGNLGQSESHAVLAWGGDVSAVIVNGHLYVMGGTGSSRGPVEAVLPWILRAPIDPRGDLGAFETITTSSGATLYMPVSVAGGRAVAVAGWESNEPVYSIYYIGGNVGDSTTGASRNVYRLEIDADGSIDTPWAKVPHGPGFVELVDPRELFAAAATNGYLYVIGGETTTQGLTTYYSFVERAEIGANGVIGPFVRLDGGNATYINEYDRASDISGAVLNNHIYIPGGRDAWGLALNQIFALSLDQGGDSLLAEPVPDVSVFDLVSDLGQETEIHSLAFDVGPDAALAAGIRVRFRTATAEGGWEDWTPYFKVSALPRDFAPASQAAGEVPFLLDFSHAPGARSCQDQALVPNPTHRSGPVTAQYIEYEVLIPEGGADQKLHRLAVDPRPIPHSALPGGYDATRSMGPHPPSCAPGNAIADMGITEEWMRVTGVGFDHPQPALDAGTVRFLSTAPGSPAITVHAVEVKEAGRVLDVQMSIGSAQGGTFTYDLVYAPAAGDPVTLMSPVLKVHAAPVLESSRSRPGLDVNPGKGLDRENVLEAPSKQVARQKFPVLLFGDNLRAGRVDDTDAIAVEDPNGPGTWPPNPDPRAASQVPVLRYKVVDVTPGLSPPLKPLKLWNAPDPQAWRDVAPGEYRGRTSFAFDLEVDHKAKSGPHDLEITVRNPQLGRTVTVTQTVYVVPAFDVDTSFRNAGDPNPNEGVGPPNQYDWTGTYNPAVADLGDGVVTPGDLIIVVEGHGFRSDSGAALVTGLQPMSPVYAPVPGPPIVTDPFHLSFAADVPANTTPKLHHFSFDWAYQVGVSDPYAAGVQVQPSWAGPATVARRWEPQAGSWLGLYVVPPRASIQTILGAHNTNDPIIVVQSDPTLTINGEGFATHGPEAGGYVSVIHEARLINTENSPAEDIHPIAGGMHMVSDCQARLTMGLSQSQQPGEMYELEIETSLPDLETRPGSKVRHPYTVNQSPSLVTVLPLPVCEAVTPSCLRADQGTRLNGVVVMGRNFDIGTTVDLGPGITIENLDVCHDDDARGCVAQDRLTFDAIVSPAAAPGSRLVQIDNGPASGVSARASCASPSFDFWVVPAPAVSSVQPSAIEQPPMAAGVKTVGIDVYGTNFVPGATIQVTLAGGAATAHVTVKPPVVVVDSGHITAELIVNRAAAEGGYRLRVAEPSGPACGTASMTADGSFQVTPFREISISSVTSQTTQCQGRAGTLSVAGTNFKDPNGGVLVGSASLGPDVTIDSMVVASPTSLTIAYSIGDGAAHGKRPLVLTPVNQGATPATRSDALTITSSPSIASVSPAAIPGGSSRQITISGRNFHVLGAAVALTPAANLTISDVSVVNPGQILATVTAAPNAGPDLRVLTVTNGDGGQCNVATMTAAFRVIPEMTITAVGNTTAQCQGRSGSLTISGTNFKDPSGASLVGSASLGPDVSIDSLVVASETEMTIGYSINEAAALGRRVLTLSSSVQGAAPAVWPDALRITSSPSILSVSPRSILSGTERQVTISGRNFYEGGAEVTVTPAAGVQVSGMSVVNSGQILVTIGIDQGVQPGSRTITVTNTDGGQCAVATLNGALQVVDPPHVTSWKFSNGKLVILGMNFHPSMQAYVGASSMPWFPVAVNKNSKVILGKAKPAFQKGVPVEVRLLNPDDGGETTIVVTR